MSVLADDAYVVVLREWRKWKTEEPVHKKALIDEFYRKRFRGNKRLPLMPYGKVERAIRRAEGWIE